MNKDKIGYLREKVYNAKRKVLEMCVSAGKGHLTTAYSCAEILTVLYYDVMRIDPRNPQWADRDRFIMSKNHGSVMQYPILADLGFFPESELTTFMADGTRLGGHSKLSIKGADFAGGSLGIGLGVGAGLVYAAKSDGKDWYTFVLVGDGEAYEGSIWEAAMFAGHHKLKNLVAILDRNRLACTDFTVNLVNQEPFADKWRSFGWDAVEVNGHDLGELLEVFGNVRERESDKPLMIIADTIKGNGIDFMIDKPLWHGKAPGGSDAERAFAELEVIL
jgi:transketolase